MAIQEIETHIPERKGFGDLEIDGSAEVSPYEMKPEAAQVLAHEAVALTANSLTDDTTLSLEAGRYKVPEHEDTDRVDTTLVRQRPFGYAHRPASDDHDGEGWMS